MKKIIIIAAVIAVAALGYYAVRNYIDNRIYRDPAFAHGNGRLEATEVNIATKLSERIAAIHANEGDFVKKGQVLVDMQTDVLKAELAQAQARKAQAVAAKTSAEASVMEKKSSCAGAEKRYLRLKGLLQKSAASEQEFETAETNYLSKKAEVAIAEADVKAAAANILAADADIARIKADLQDSKLIAPQDGRIQYRIAEPGEVLASGGKVLNLVDLSDVYMTFFLPEATAGKVKIGAEVRILLDAIPNIPIPAEVTFVSSVAQFTPKTVETQIERQKLMFRVKARIKPELLKKYIEYVKTGLPGVAWVKINPDAQWPEFLKLRSGK
ncbi:MAG: efflux RND transporter periplasmic adaptor subunit [Lentisphaeria bacterium]|nr:efflux RND transporter periplasmic adaptor subunit [Lentisphaeria bacterium]